MLDLTEKKDPVYWTQLYSHLNNEKSLQMMGKWLIDQLDESFDMTKIPETKSKQEARLNGLSTVGKFLYHEVLERGLEILNASMNTFFKAYQNSCGEYGMKQSFTSLNTFSRELGKFGIEFKRKRVDSNLTRCCNVKTQTVLQTFKDKNIIDQMYVDKFEISDNLDSFANAVL